MSDSTGKHRKRYVDHPNDIYKLTCLVYGPGNSSDKYKVLGDFGFKYYNSGLLRTTFKNLQLRKNLAYSKRTIL